MDPTVVDTDILSELLKGRDPRVLLHATNYRRQFGCLTISTISVFEITKGFTKAGREARISQFVSFLTQHQVISFDTDAAMIAGSITAKLELAGMTVGRIDPMIAAIAIRNGLTLATGNMDHYRRVQALGFGLEISNWREA